jgi:hypothetical protein
VGVTGRTRPAAPRPDCPDRRATTAGFLAKLKNQAQAMVTRLRQDVYTDLVAVAITTVPDMPSLPETRVPLLPSKRTRQSAQLVRMARERGITPVTPN